MKVNGREEKQDSSPEGRSRGGMPFDHSWRIWRMSGRARVMVGPVDQPGRGAGLMALPAWLRDHPPPITLRITATTPPAPAPIVETRRSSPAASARHPSSARSRPSKPSHVSIRCSESNLRLLLLRSRGPSHLHQEVGVGDAPFNECHPGMVLDLHPPAGGQVIDDNDVAITW